MHPMNIIGHTAQLQALTQDREKGNVSHAYLFAGPRNVGKMTVAHAVACDLLTHGKDQAEADDICAKAAKLIHPDILVLDQLWIEGVCDDWDAIAKSSNVPQVHRSKAPKAKTDVISIDDIRALHDRLHETGTGTYRCCLVRSVERMQDAAVNAFLKLLEEPPKGVVFFLTTQKLSSLLPTIVSRCRVMHFSRLSAKELQPILADIDPEDAPFILKIANGAPGTAIALNSDPDLLREHRQIHQIAARFWTDTSLLGRLSALIPLHNRGKESDRFLFHLGASLRGLSAQHIERCTPSFNRLHAALQTNTHRQLVTQRFAMEVHS